MTNQGRLIPILTEAINDKKQQFIIKTIHQGTLTVKTTKLDNKIMKYVNISKSNNENEILDFLKDNTMAEQKYYLWIDIEDTYKRFCVVYTKYFTNNGPKLIRCTERLQIISDKDEQTNVIKLHHEGKTNHRGITQTTTAIKRKYHWGTMYQDIIQESNSPWSSPVHLVPKKRDANWKIQWRMVTDYRKINNKSISENWDAVNILLHSIWHQVTIRLKWTHKIRLKQPSVHNEEIMNSNGIIERMHSTLIEHLRILRAQDKKTNIKILVKYALIAYNNSIHASTSYTPLELILGHTNSRDPFDMFLDTRFYKEYVNDHINKLNLIYENIKEKIHTTKEKIAGTRNPTESHSFKTGQTVYVKKTSNIKGKTKEKFEGPYVIQKIFDDNTVEIRKNNQVQKVHLRLLRRPVVTDTVQDDVPQQSTSRT